MKKCPNCKVKTINTFNKYNMLPNKSTSCSNCDAKLTSSSNFLMLISIPYILFAIILFVLHVPIDQNRVQFLSILLGSGVVMYIIQNIFIPYKVINEKK